ncbi:DnaD domain protein [Staphylococcus epidermidis]|uniref:DnaD domain-containing protein n=1 Tax=Staphylococcus epidermidis TaxID=1282 RepID=UPI001C55D3D1|nr:DnaD domain protein [Staphylococcus epidermidis]QXV20055.1 DnaD domain protein [Staphylococcus epidermidis]QXV20111.1 DnaD domain protein [Staphylococcus epidermidis]
MTGWIKLHRKLLDSPIFQNEKLFKVFAYCLMKASHKEHTQLVGRRVVHLKKGQFVFGRKRASEELRLKESTVRDYVKLLEKLGTIDIKSDNKFSVITVVNWAIYQNDEEISDSKNDKKSTTNQHQMDNKSTSNQQQINTNKNVKNEKNDKNVKNEKNVVVGDDFATIYNLYQENIEQIPSPITTEKLTQDMDHYGKELVAYAIRKAALNNSHNYKFIDYLLKDWRKRNLTTIKAVEQYEQQRQEQKEQSYKPKVTQSREKTPEWLKNRNQEKETVNDDPEFEKLRLQFQKQLESDWDD